MSDDLRQDSVLDRLDGMLANLQSHIDERAQELAQPLIYDAREAAATEVKRAQDKQQRAEDLVTELRRQIRVRDRQRDEQRQRADSAESTVARVWDLARVYEVNAATADDAGDTAARNWCELFAGELRDALEPPQELLAEEETADE
ncbi:hypothetical protein ABZW49_10525 [Nonomuraea wenchangensis]